MHELTREMVTNAGLLGTGYPSALAGMTVRMAMLAQKYPNLVAMAADVGTSSAIGIIGNVALTGDTNLTGESVSQAVALLAGFRYAKFKIGQKENVPENNTKFSEGPELVVKNENKESFLDKIFGKSDNKVNDNVDTNNLDKNGIANCKNKKDFETKIKDLNDSSNRKMSEDDINKISKGLYNLKKNYPEEFDKLVKSGIFNAVKEGKITLEDLKIESLSNGQTTFSKEYLEDCQKIQKNEECIKDYRKDTPLESVANELENGETANIGGILYIKGSNGMEKLNISKEKYMELFPPMERFNIQQNQSKYAGDCWFLETLNNFYKNPNTRAEIVKMFRQDGNDLY